MSTIKSSAENLTLNADGANNDIKFQSNGSEVASIDQAGTITATTFTGAGSTPSIVDGGNATAMTIDSNEKVGIGTASPAAPLQVRVASDINWRFLEASSHSKWLLYLRLGSFVQHWYTVPKNKIIK